MRDFHAEAVRIWPLTGTSRQGGCHWDRASARRARSQEDRDKARADRAAQVDADLRRLWGLYPGLVGSVDGWLSEPFRLRNRRANALRTREREDERKRVRKRLMRQLRRDRERMRQRQEAIERGSVVCRARTIEEVLAAAGSFVRSSDSNSLILVWCPLPWVHTRGLPCGWNF